MTGRVYIAWVFASCYAVAGCQPDLDPRCTQRCELAERCGFLPSAFGGGSDPQGNCALRCTLSPTDSERADFEDCVPSREIAERDLHARCETVRTCLSQMFPGPVVGKASVAIRVGLYEGRCEGGGVVSHPDEITAFCQEHAVVSVDAYVLRGLVKEQTRQQSCFDALSTPIELDELAPGVVRVGVDIRVGSREDAGMGGSEAAVDGCYGWQSEPLNLRANESAVAPALRLTAPQLACPEDGVVFGSCAAAATEPP